jgi:hypothetical protein
MGEKLKACPFCGGKVTQGEDWGEPIVICDSCEYADVPLAAFNRRTPPDRLVIDGHEFVRVIPCPRDESPAPPATREGRGDA